MPYMNGVQLGHDEGEPMHLKSRERERQSAGMAGHPEQLPQADARKGMARP
jgi:hypothetical protein